MKNATIKNASSIMMMVLAMTVILASMSFVAFAGNDIDLPMDEFEEETLMLGDVNADGSITGADALAIYLYVFDAEANPIDEKLADVNGDAAATGADALAIYLYIFDPQANPIG